MIEIFIPIFIIIILLLLNALFVASEFAIIGLPKVVAEKLASKGKKAAARVSLILSDSRLQDLYITTAQLGITLASLGLGMYGEHVIAEWIYKGIQYIYLDSKIIAHTISTIISIIILTYLHIVIGEIIPKSIALKYVESTALFVTPLMAWIQLILYPFIYILNWIGNSLLKLFGVDRQANQNDSYHTSEEIQYIVQESLESGLIEPEAANVLNEILEFGELTAKEVMVPRVKIIALPLNINYDELLSKINENSHTRYPIYEESIDNIVGFVHIKDILKMLDRKLTFEKEKIRKVIFLPESIAIDKIFAIMRKENTQMVVIIDEYGGTEGLITVEDIFQEVIGV